MTHAGTRSPKAVVIHCSLLRVAMKPSAPLTIFCIILAVLQLEFYNVMVLGFGTTTCHYFSPDIFKNVRKTALSFTSSDEGNDSDTIQKLTRPEKKALERQRKEKKLQKGKRITAKSVDGRRDTSVGQQHKHLSEQFILLDSQEILQAIKRAQYMHDERTLTFIQKSLLDNTVTSTNETAKSPLDVAKCSILARLAVAFLNIRSQPRALEVINIRKAALGTQEQSASDPSESASIVRALLRYDSSGSGSGSTSTSNDTVISSSTVFDVAMDTLEEELPFPSSSATKTAHSEEQDQYERELIKYRSLTLLFVASYCFKQGDVTLAFKACDMLRLLGPMVIERKVSVQMPWIKLIQSAASYESLRRAQHSTLPAAAFADANVVYSVLDCMNTFPSENDDAVYEALSNSLVRRVEFVTGAVSMKDLPPPDRGEVAFIGRSNVGKSSLVNMVTNRKSLAYISKRPGKTQQFNYFAVNDKPELLRELKYGDNVGGQKDRDSFYIVDLPGFGYAEVPEQQRRKWSDFMQLYVSNRGNLRVVFHLVDSRHGPSFDDERIMKDIGTILSKKQVAYAIVLTKSDKVGKVSQKVMESLRTAMKNAYISSSPVLLTSAETKLGRDDVWRYLKLAAEF